MPPIRFAAHRASFADLRAEGAKISRKTVAASMRRQRLAGISPRRFGPVTTVVDLDAHCPRTWSSADSTAVSSTRSGHRNHLPVHR
jgi:hypothetical protein